MTKLKSTPNPGSGVLVNEKQAISYSLLPFPQPQNSLSDLEAVGNQSLQRLLKSRGFHQLRTEHGDAPSLDVLQPMQNAFGRSFSDVRLHKGNLVDEAAESIDAASFTMGSDIYVHSKAPDLGTIAGRCILGEEFAHVAQGVGTAQIGRITTPADSVEREAAEAGKAVSTAKRVDVGPSNQAPPLLARSWWDSIEGGGGAGGAGASDTGAEGAGAEGTHGGDADEKTDVDGAPPEAGPEMRFSIGKLPFTFDSQKLSTSLSKKVEMKFFEQNLSAWFPVGGPVGISVTAGVAAGIEASASVAASFDTYDELPAPFLGYQQRATISGGMSVGPSASGNVFIGAGLGAAAANVSGGFVGSLTAEGTASAGLQGAAIRNYYTGMNEWGDWAGEINMPITMSAELKAGLSAALRWNLVGESGEWFSIKVGDEWKIATAEVTCNARIGIPSGEDLSDITTKFELNPPPFSLDQGNGPPPWEQGGGGMEGSGPWSGSEENQGQGGAPAAATGQGGAPPN